MYPLKGKYVDGLYIIVNTRMYVMAWTNVGPFYVYNNSFTTQNYTAGKQVDKWAYIEQAWDIAHMQEITPRALYLLHLVPICIQDMSLVSVHSCAGIWNIKIYR